MQSSPSTRVLYLAHSMQKSSTEKPTSGLELFSNYSRIDRETADSNVDGCAAKNSMNDYAFDSSLGSNNEDAGSSLDNIDSNYSEQRINKLQGPKQKKTVAHPTSNANLETRNIDKTRRSMKQNYTENIKCFPTINSERAYYVRNFGMLDTSLMPRIYCLLAVIWAEGT